MTDTKTHAAVKYSFSEPHRRESLRIGIYPLAPVTTTIGFVYDIARRLATSGAI